MTVSSLFVWLWLKLVGAVILKLWSPPLSELHTMCLRIELKYFGYLYIVIHICNFMGIVTVYNWKLTCVLVRQIFFSFTLFSLVSFYSEQLLVKHGFFCMGVFWFLLQIFISTIWANLVCAFLPLECLTLFRTVFIPPWILGEDISVSADT